jgi:hypothetical protein
MHFNLQAILADNAGPLAAGGVVVLIFRERGRARNWHGRLYRQRLGSGVPVIDIWALRRNITSFAR